MSIHLLRKLEELEEGVRDFRTRLSGAPVMLERAETAWRIYSKAKAELWTVAGNLHETKGLAAGLAIASKSPDAVKELVKGEVRDEKLEADEGKRQVARLDSAKSMIAQAAAERQREASVLSGRCDGIFWSAESHLHELANVLSQMSRFEEDDEEDPDGPGYNSRKPPEVVPEEKPARRKRLKKDGKGG